LQHFKEEQKMPSRNGWRYDRQNNRLEVQVASQVVGYFPGRGSDFTPQGNAFYVDTAGSDDYNGLSPQTPLLTVDAALAKCTDDENDYIFVLDCWAEDDYPITVDKSTVHIIGVGLPAPWSFPTLNGGGTDTIRISANYAELAGFSMVSASADGVHFYANVGYGWLHHLNFAVAATSVVNGIEFDSTYGTNSLVEDCTFGATSSHVTGYGLYGGAHQCEIRNNNFMACATTGIYITGGNTGKIHDNYFALADDVNGEAITLAAGVSGFLVVNNIAASGMLSNGYSYNPYRDLAANTANHWGMNYRGNAVVEPVGI
jgi:hypothetical protein